MIPQTLEELDSIAKECRKMTTKAALLSAAGVTIPAPGVDVATDITILISLLQKY
jgi:hypothetical protein